MPTRNFLTMELKTWMMNVLKESADAPPYSTIMMEVKKRA